MNNQNISSTVFAKGISQDGLVKLLGDIRNVVEEANTNLNDYNLLINDLRAKENTSEKEEKINDFISQIAESNNNINNELNKIENIFNRILKDWEEYQSLNVSNLENKEEESDE